MAKKALIILAEGFEEIEAVTPVDLLRRAGIEVTAAGLGSTTVKGAHGIHIGADMTLDAAGGDFDAIICPGGMPGTTNLMASDMVISRVRAVFESGKLCAAICAAPMVLDKAGVLKNKRYTCYPGTEKRIQSGTWIEKDVVRDGSVITARAPGAAIAFSLEIIDALLSSGAGRRIAEAIVFKNIG